MPLLSPVLQRWPIYLFSALIILIALDTMVGERGALHLWRLRGEKNRLDEQNFRMQKENEALRERVYRLRNDDAFLEKLAREELNLVRPGEVVYRFPNRETRAARKSIDEPNRVSRPDGQSLRFVLENEMVVLVHVH
jgi:cell division protein FtsB